jgi:hypothetical protein
MFTWLCYYEEIRGLSDLDRAYLVLSADRRRRISRHHVDELLIKRALSFRQCLTLFSGD